MMTFRGTRIRAPKLLVLSIISVCLSQGCGDASTSGGGSTSPAFTADTGSMETSDAGEISNGGVDVESPDTEVMVNDEQITAAVDTTEGVVIGQLNGDILSWLGIPYADAPIDTLRWRPPQKAPSHEETLQATEYGNICPQPTAPSADSPLQEDEDCLSLNIWSPAGAEVGELPVMVWIHGGSFTSGSGALDLYNGSSMAARDVVTVTINYRLGALGFLVHEELVGTEGYQGAGNYGLLDQQAALSWLQDNIAKFGGDPTKVTVFGESAGAISICALMASPLSDGLFAQAIMQSGFCSVSLPYASMPRQTIEPATVAGAQVATALGCEIQGEALSCLRGKTFDELRAVDFEATPVIDDHVLTDDPATIHFRGETLDVPLLMGSNADEGTIFADRSLVTSPESYTSTISGLFGAFLGPRVLEQYPLEDYDSPFRAFASIVGDLYFVCPARFAAEQHVTNDRQVWLYHFTHVTQFGELRDIGAFHGSEIGFVFETNDFFFAPSDEESALSKTMQQLWTSFAISGQPTADDVAWTPLDNEQQNGLELNGERVEMIQGYRKAFCDFWRDAF